MADTFLGKLKSFNQAVGAVSTSPGIAQLNAIAALDPDRLAAEIAVEDGKLREPIRQMLLANMRASGLQKRTGTMEAAIANVIVDVTRGNLFIHMQSGLKYPPSSSVKTRKRNDTGDPYAAAGAFRYGAVRQPRKKTHYKDLPTGVLKKLKKGKGGQFGESVKRAVKRVIVKGGKLTEREAKGPAARLLQMVRPEVKNLYTPTKTGGHASVIKPRADFFQLTSAQLAALEQLRFEGCKAALGRLGVEVAG